MNQILDLLHILLCDKLHASDMLTITTRTSDKCYYYLENDIAEGNQMEDHLKWYDHLENFKLTLNLKTDREVQEFLHNCLKLSHKIQDLSAENPARLTFIKQILEVS